ncbi:MAG: hypothetical protein ABIZ57_11550 [Candidatus Limnocylindria bacterium]
MPNRIEQRRLLRQLREALDTRGLVTTAAIGQSLGDGLVERRTQTPRVAARTDGWPERRIGLLRGHEGTGAYEAVRQVSPVCRLGDREVDQAGNGTHDDVARLHVEVQDPLCVEVVQRRCQLAAQGEGLLGIEAPMTTDGGREARTLDVLHLDEWTIAIRIHVEQPGQARMLEATQQRPLARHGPA